MDIYLCEMSSSDCPRNIKSLQEGIKSMDAEYDKCHDVWAKGESVSVYNIYRYIELELKCFSYIYALHEP